jgi:hypothetical protein
MPYFLVTVKPGNKAPYIRKISARNDEEADEAKRKAEESGVVAEWYHKATDDVHLASHQLRSQVRTDFGEKSANSNFRRE